MPTTKGISWMEIVKDREVKGLSKAEIAKKRKISASTVDYHLMMAKKEGLIDKVRRQSSSNSQPTDAWAR
jgi:transposase